MDAIIEARGLGHAFDSGPPVFSGLDLQVARGEFLTLVGASGSGKSTLLRVLLGLLAPQRGSVHMRVAPDSAKLPSAIVFQEARLMPWRRIADNVGLGLEGLALSQSERAARIEQALELVRLSDLAQRWPRQLSGGQRQRIGIARALAVDPALLLMDEPFGALDAITRAGLQDELLRIWRTTSKSILFVTHDIDEAVKLGERVLLLGGAPAHIVRSFTGGNRRDADRPASANELAETARNVRSSLELTMEDGAGI